MASEEALEEKPHELTPILYPTNIKTKVNEKGRIKKFFSNENVVLALFTLGAAAIVITLLMIAGILGVSFPASAWWY